MVVRNVVVGVITVTILHSAVSAGVSNLLVLVDLTGRYLVLEVFLRLISIVLLSTTLLLLLVLVLTVLLLQLVVITVQQVTLLDVVKDSLSSQVEVDSKELLRDLTVGVDLVRVVS